MVLFSLDIGEMISNWWTSFLENVLWRLFYWVEILICKFIGFMEDVMMIFTGQTEVTYANKEQSLIKVFFNHSSTKSIYGAIALIGIVFAFTFAIFSVIKKVLDLRDKQQGVTLGIILTNLLKSILLIASMNLIMYIALETTDKLVAQIDVAVTNSGSISKGSDTITFDDEEFAAMGRIFNTIGNYSINPSYRSRYNLNACYNDIRGDLEYLGRRGVFNYHYVSYTGNDRVNGKVVPTWQSLVERLARAYDYNQETTLDSYNDGLTGAMLDVMDTMKKDDNIKVLKSFTRERETNTKRVPMDRIFFLIGTMGNIDGSAAARVEQYNKEPSFTDPVRAPFYYGESDIYNYDQVKAAFDPSPGSTNYIIVYVVAISILQEMLVIIVTCSVRIFSLLVLYFTSPLVIAAIPLDDGAKLKQWTTAFLVQLLGIVGMVLAMKVYLMFLPIIWSPSLEVSSSTILTIIIKCVISYGAITAVSRVNGMLTGILADNAGWQAISAGDMRGNVQNSSAGRLLGSMSGSNIGSSLAKGAWNKTGGKALSAAGSALKKGTVGKLYTKITGKDYETGQKTEAQKTKDERNRQRKMKDLKANLDHVGKTGRDLKGNLLSDSAKTKMQKTYEKMQAGMGFDDARKSAAQDMKADKKDLAQDARNKVRELKNPPPARNDLPQNQNNQV